MTRVLAALFLLLAGSAARADKIVLVAGGDGPDGSPATQARLTSPFAVAFGPDGTTYIVEMVKGERLRAINTKGELITLAGTGVKGHTGDGGPGLKATFNGMHHLVVGPDGAVYLADTFNACVRKFDPKTGTVSAFAGTGEKGFTGDGGPAVRAKFGGCYCLCFDAGGKHLYITDLENRRIRKVELATGTISTVAGNGKRGIPTNDADAKTQPLIDPRAHTIDAKGNLYIVERSGHALRVVDPAGKIRTVAGTGKAGAGAGVALKAAMNGPKNLCIDRDGSVLIADTENHRIVRYIPDEGKLVVVAGTGKKGTAGVGGDPTKAELSQPHGVIVHPKTGDIYIADSSNNRILKIVRE